MTLSFTSEEIHAWITRQTNQLERILKITYREEINPGDEELISQKGNQITYEFVESIMNILENEKSFDIIMSTLSKISFTDSRAIELRMIYKWNNLPEYLDNFCKLKSTQQATYFFGKYESTSALRDIIWIYKQYIKILLENVIRVGNNH